MAEPFKEPKVLTLEIRQYDNGFSCEHTGRKIEKYLQRVSSAKQSLYSTSLLFSGTHTVLPLHCNKAINSLAEGQKLIQDFCEFLRPMLSVSHISSVPHYSTLCMLYEIKERIDNLSKLIGSYIPSYNQPRSSFAAKQRHYISLSFEILLQHIADLLLQIEQPEKDAPARKVPVPLLLADYQNKSPQVEQREQRF